MLKHFPDPDMPDFTDSRLRSDAEVVPEAVIEAFELHTAEITAMETGSYNIHFKVDRAGELFDLRRSNRPNAPGNLQYEAEILLHLRHHGFDLAPEIVPAPTGEANLWVADAGWTLFRWMGDGPGKTFPPVTPGQVKSAARVLSEFHAVSRDLEPVASRGDWPIFVVPTIEPETWLRRANSLATELCNSNEYEGDGQDLREMSRTSATELESVDFDRLPEFMCHGDYRMRNLQFTGDDVTGVFDIDTSIRATRLLDLGGAATRFSPLGGNPQADVDSGAAFLSAYHTHAPLSAYEIEVLPILIRWRLLRDVVAYFDLWWSHVRDVCAALFEGAADEMVERASIS